jgi:P27 family predicted phage terminase small subunit
MKGRKPKPTHLKLIQGNPGRRPLNKAEPQPARGAMPLPPAELGPDAKITWAQVAPELWRSGVLTSIDHTVLRFFAISVGRAIEAERIIAEMGRDELTRGLMIKTAGGNAIQNPMLAIANRAMADAVKYGAELGLSPASRSRISAVEPSAPDPGDEYFK